MQPEDVNVDDEQPHDGQLDDGQLDDEQLDDGQGRHLIGWREYVSFPDWGVTGVKAKIDTGARTSALHVENIQLIDDHHIQFDVVVNRYDPVTHVSTVAKISRRTQIRPSTGVPQRRYIVQTVMAIGSVRKVVELSLVSRKHMICRMLLGRTALAGDFLVDIDREYLYGRPSMKLKKKKKTKKKSKKKKRSKLKKGNTSA
jgi:hypothetical protein